MRVLVDLVQARVVSVVAGASAIGPTTDQVGYFIPGQKLTGDGLAPNTRVAGVRQSGSTGGAQCPCVTLDRPAIASRRDVDVSATGPNPRVADFDTSDDLAEADEGRPIRRDLSGLAFGPHSLAVGNLRGELTFLGASGERTRSSRPAIVINEVGRGGATVEANLAPSQQAALLLLRSDLTVNLRGTNDQLTEVTRLRSSDVARARFASGLLTRFGLARLTGGCVYVPHAPNPLFTTQLDSAYASIARDIARRSGCDYVEAFSRVWPRSQAIKWTTDGSHPTTKGYERLAGALAAKLAPRSELR